MYKVTLHYDEIQIASAESARFTDAAELAIEEMPACYMAVPHEVDIRVSKGSEHQFAVPLAIHLKAVA
jgi:hypothetical protein